MCGVAAHVIFSGFPLLLGRLFETGIEDILLLYVRSVIASLVQCCAEVPACVSQSLMVAMRVSAVSRAALNSLALLGARQGRARLQGPAFQVAFLNYIRGGKRW